MLHDSKSCRSTIHNVGMHRGFCQVLLKNNVIPHTLAVNLNPMFARPGIRSQITKTDFPWVRRWSIVPRQSHALRLLTTALAKPPAGFEFLSARHILQYKNNLFPSGLSNLREVLF